MSAPLWYTQPEKKVTQTPWMQPAQSATASPIAPPAEATPYVASTVPTTATPEFNAQNWQNMTNLARRSATSSWNSGEESLKRSLGGSGFRAGESGVADSALGQYWAGKAENLGQTTSQMAVEEAKNQFLQNFNLDQFNFAKDKWSQEFGASREDQATQDMLAYLNLMNQNQTTPYAAYWGALNNSINS